MRLRLTPLFSELHCSSPLNLQNTKAKFSMPQSGLWLKWRCSRKRIGFRVLQLLHGWGSDWLSFASLIHLCFARLFIPLVLWAKLLRQTIGKSKEAVKAIEPPFIFHKVETMIPLPIQKFIHRKLVGDSYNSISDQRSTAGSDKSDFNKNLA